MKRDEFKRSIKGSLCQEYGYQLTDTIYDDFESMTCENCRYISEVTGDYFCTHNLNRFNYTDKDFGCNKFERKPNDN